MNRLWPRKAQSKVGSIGHNSVDSHYQQSLHFRGIVDGPHVYFKTRTVISVEERRRHGRNSADKRWYLDCVLV
jgi:hypothetical protein